MLDQRALPIATPEKALLDSIAHKKLNTTNLEPEQIYQFVIESFRIEESTLLNLSTKALSQLAILYRNNAPQLFAKALMQRKNKK